MQRQPCGHCGDAPQRDLGPAHHLAWFMRLAGARYVWLCQKTVTRRVLLPSDAAVQKSERALRAAATQRDRLLASVSACCIAWPRRLGCVEPWLETLTVPGVVTLLQQVSSTDPHAAQTTRTMMHCGRIHELATVLKGVWRHIAFRAGEFPLEVPGHIRARCSPANSIQLSPEIPKRLVKEGGAESGGVQKRRFGFERCSLGL